MGEQVARRMTYHDPTEALAHAPRSEVREYFARRNIHTVLPGEGGLACSESFWRERRVIVTGCGDFLGSLVAEYLRVLGCRQVFFPSEREYDLTSQADVRRLFGVGKPDVVLHLAEQVGGIGANRDRPGEFYYTNLMMSALMIEEARKGGVGKFVQMGSITSYPRYTPVPFREEDFWNGYPDESNAAYGIAKKAPLVQLQAYRAQYGFCGIYLVPANLYGPRDDFHPATSYVIPALIRKMVEATEAGEQAVTVWGSGQASREFLYVDDCARAVLLAAEHYEGPDPVNVGTGREVKIATLASMIAEQVGFEGELVFDRTRPEGQPRRCLSTAKAQQLFGFVARTSLREGLAETIQWYRAHRQRFTGAGESSGMVDAHA
jgi:GDP-L-fucose synthase